jgi:hypothetical protein
MDGKRAWMVPAFVLGSLLILASCELPWDPVEVEVYSTTFASPDDAGVIDAEQGVKFVFTSNVWPGTTWWGRFEVPVTGEYNIAHTGQPVFEMTIHENSQYSSIVATPANGETVTLSLDAGIPYYVEGFQPGEAMMGGTAIWVWAD